MSTDIPTPDDPMYSVDTVAKMFDVEQLTIRNWIKQDKLHAIKVMGRWRILRSEVERLVNEQHA